MISEHPFRIVEERHRSLRHVRCRVPGCEWKSESWGFHVSKQRLIGFWRAHRAECHREESHGPDRDTGAQPSER